MAFMGYAECSECGQRKMMNLNSHGRVCLDCERELKRIAREKHFEFLDTLPIEARLRKVEEWIYDYKPKYVPPTKYA